MTQRTGTTARTRRFAATAVALLAAVLVAGCDDKDPSPQAAPPPPPPDPKEELLAAVPDEEHPAFRFTTSDASGTVSGVIDPVNRGMEMKIVEKDKDFTLEMAFRVVEARTWMKVKIKGDQDIQKLMKLPTTWMELDPAKMAGAEPLPAYEGNDPGNTEVLISAASDIQSGGDGTYTGVVDFSTQPELVEAMDEVAPLDKAAEPIPFTAVVGPDGNLSSLTLAIPAIGKQKKSEYVVEYSDFGAAPQIVPFAEDKAKPAPTAAYDMLNDD